MSSATCAVRLSWCERTFESLPKLDAGALIGVNELYAAAIVAGGPTLENYCRSVLRITAGWAAAWTTAP